eukprot:6488140-Amphidinium_carterae.2
MTMLLGQFWLAQRLKAIFYSSYCSAMCTSSESLMGLLDNVDDGPKTSDGLQCGLCGKTPEVRDRKTDQFSTWTNNRN